MSGTEGRETLVRRATLLEYATIGWNALEAIVAVAAGVAAGSIALIGLLAGLVLNATVEWWWADPLAALGIAYPALREGLEAWQGGREHDSRAPGEGWPE